MALRIAPKFGSIFDDEVTTRLSMFGRGAMYPQSKVRLDRDDHEFIKNSRKQRHFRGLGEYVRDAVSAKVKQNRHRLRHDQKADCPGIGH
jgi:hypothetical protein